NGIELHVIQVAVLKAGFPRGAGLQVREYERLQTRIERATRQAVLLGDGVLLIGREIFHGLAWEHALQLWKDRAGRRARVFAVKVGGVRVLDDRQALVRVHQSTGVWHAADSPGVDVHGLERPATAATGIGGVVEVDLSRPPGKVPAARAGSDDLQLCSVCADLRDIDDGDSIWRIDHQRVA